MRKDLQARIPQSHFHRESLPSSEAASLSPHEGAVVPGQLAIWAAAVEGDAADAAGVVVGHPLPRRHPVPPPHRHLKLMDS